MKELNKEYPIYNPHSNEAFDEQTSDIVGEALKFAMSMAKTRQELLEFYEEPMNNRHFKRLQEKEKVILRKEWKRLMDEFTETEK